MILIIKNKPKTKLKIERILNFSIEINGNGIVSARYKEINQHLTKKSDLNFSIISLFQFNLAI